MGFRCFIHVNEPLMVMRKAEHTLNCIVNDATKSCCNLQVKTGLRDCIFVYAKIGGGDGVEPMSVKR